VGGLKHKGLKFNPITAESGSAMLFLAVASLLVPSFFIRVGGAAHQKSVNSISLFIAGILILTYFLGMIFTFKTHKYLFRSSKLIEKNIEAWPLRKSILLLLFAGIIIGCMSELLVSSIEVTIRTLHLSETFIGIIVVAVIGNAAEHITAVFFAYKNKMDLALEISLGSSVQIALFVAPLLVFASYFLGHPMPLIFTMMEIIAVALSTGIIAILSLDGKSNWFEGCQLLALYIILAVVFYFY
jgi:Ca2+:H+ antiporter